jgi:hypothetical protein
MTDQTHPTPPFSAILRRNDVPEPAPPGPGRARRFVGRLLRILGLLATGGVLTITGIVLWFGFSRSAPTATPAITPTIGPAASLAAPATSVPPTQTPTAVPTAVPTVVPTAIPTAVSKPSGRTQPDDVCNVRFRSDEVYVRVEAPFCLGHL